VEVLKQAKFVMMTYSRLALSITGIASIAVFIAVQITRNRRHEVNIHAVTPSPLKTKLPNLEKNDINYLAYGQNYFPGARDVNTPYGSCRVYEFGPEDGHKVLLSHGISTPCISLGGLAHELVNRGCRVMLYGKSSDDLYGYVQRYSTCGRSIWPRVLG
jgi:hypothetical protein